MVNVIFSDDLYIITNGLYVSQGSVPSKIVVLVYILNTVMSDRTAEPYQTTTVQLNDLRPVELPHW